MAWSSALPLLLAAVLIAFEERVSMPSCETTASDGRSVGWDVKDGPDDFKVMMVADLLLLGPDAGFANFYFRDVFTTKFFRKSFERLKPDMLVVLGDVSAKGSELTENKWLSLLQQFKSILGPFLGLPLHVVLGDRDIGECIHINTRSVEQISSILPALGSSGCGVFEISNISFVSLNAVALLCGNNDLRFSVEKVIERESLDLQMQTKGTGGAYNSKLSASLDNSDWRQNDVIAGSGPVVLLHFPLYHSTSSSCEVNILRRNLQHKYHETPGSSRPLDQRVAAGTGPYGLTHTLPPNATEYIFQALKPSIIFSAHSHYFCDHTHGDGTREVTVPAMTWAARDDPGFIVVTFGQNKAVTVSHCSLARESHVLMAYAFVFVLVIATALVTGSSHMMSLVGF